MRTDRVKLMPALAAGALAIDVNTALLALSDALGLPTAHGGLLRFLQMWGYRCRPDPCSRWDFTSRSG